MGSAPWLFSRTQAVANPLAGLIVDNLALRVSKNVPGSAPSLPSAWIVQRSKNLFNTLPVSLQGIVRSNVIPQGSVHLATGDVLPEPSIDLAIGQ